MEFEIILPADLDQPGYLRHMINDDVRSFSQLGTIVERFAKGFYSLRLGLDLLDGLLDMLGIDPEIDMLWPVARELMANPTRSYISTKRLRSLFEKHGFQDVIDLALTHPFLSEKGSRVQMTFLMDDYLLTKKMINHPEERKELRKYIRWKTLTFLKKAHSESLELVESRLVATKNKHVLEQNYEKAAQLRNIEKMFLIEVYRRYWPDLDMVDGEGVLKEIAGSAQAEFVRSKIGGAEIDLTPPS